jgi:Tol biopolymer transport system component
MLDIGRLPKLIPCRYWLAFSAGILLLAHAAHSGDRPASDIFMVIDQGTALLGPDGEEIERLDSLAHAAGALSADGRWIAFAQSRQTEPEGSWEHNLVIQSRADPRDRRTVPLVWGSTGSSFLPLWSSDGKRILICEQGWRDKVRESAFRMYDLNRKDLTELKLPEEWWPSDWSADGKRLLSSLGATGRVAWVNIDGTGEPAFITRELEVAYGARLSPDGRRILCKAGFRRPNDERPRRRLSVVDLETRKRTIVDEPGETHGYCWSPDGSRIAYTWQRPLEKPAEVAVRETLLITCDPDGANRKTVTSRKYEVPPNSSATGGTIIFFQVLAWR